MSRLPPVLTTDHLPLAELCAARLDGELFPLDACFCPIDEPDLPALRAAAIVTHLPGRLIAEQNSAAWILGALWSPPLRHEFCTDISARARPSNVATARVREVVIAPEEIVRVGGLDVTTPLRTAIDLARCRPEFGDAERQTVARLMDIGRFGLQECREALDARRNLPNKRLAIERLQSVEPSTQPALTR